MLRLERITAEPGADSLSREWDELFASSPWSTPFQSRSWLTAWWSTSSSGRTPHISLIREGDDLVGLAPFCLSRSPWRTLRFMGTGVSDYLEPLCRPGYEIAVGEALRDEIAATKGVDLVDWQQVRAGRADLCPLRNATITHQACCPVLSLPSTFEEYLSRLGKSLRYDIRKGFESDVKVRWASDRDEAHRFFEIFLDLHERRWRKRWQPGAFALSKIREFHRSWLAGGVQHDQLRLGTAWHDGRPIGAIYALRAGHATFFYQSGMLPDAKAMSPGTILIASAIRRAIDEGCLEFDFLRGDEPYKMRWKPTEVRENVRIVARHSVVLGGVAMATQKLHSRVEATVRARLEGKGLIG